MFKLLTATTALVMAGGAGFAADLTGEIEVKIEENAAGNYGATTSLDLGMSSLNGMAYGWVDLKEDGGNITLDEYQIGTTVAGAKVSFGDQGNVWIASEDGATLADPAMAESIQVAAYGATVGIGFTDIGADVTDIENVQGRYELGLGTAVSVTAAGDYNLNSEDWAFGGRADAWVNDNISVGSAFTYGSANETVAFESDVTAFGITAYLNGDQDDMAQNVGGSYAYAWNGMDLGAGVNYNIDSADVEPNVTVGFAF